MCPAKEKHWSVKGGQNRANAKSSKVAHYNRSLYPTQAQSMFAPSAPSMHQLKSHFPMPRKARLKHHPVFLFGVHLLINHRHWGITMALGCAAWEKPSAITSWWAWISWPFQGLYCKKEAVCQSTRCSRFVGINMY